MSDTTTISSHRTTIGIIGNVSLSITSQTLRKSDLLDHLYNIDSWHPTDQSDAIFVPAIEPYLID